MGSAPHSPETAKGSYVWKDVARSATDAGLPYQWPEPFPFNSLMAARIFYYIAEKDETKAIEWAQAVFDASFGQGRDCSDSSELAAIAKDLGLDGEELLNATKQDAIKQTLKQVTSEAMAMARPDAIFMHCLPAHRGEAVDADVPEGPRSVVFDQAENRLHTPQALLLLMFGPTHH